MNDIDRNISDDGKFEQFIELCKQMYVRMEQDGTLERLAEENLTKD